MVYLEVISKHSMIDFIEENMILIYYKHQVSIANSYVIISDTFETTFHNDIIINIQYQLSWYCCHWYLQLRKEKNDNIFCFFLYVPLLNYLCYQRKQSHH